MANKPNEEEAATRLHALLPEKSVIILVTLFSEMHNGTRSRHYKALAVKNENVVDITRDIATALHMRYIINPYMANSVMVMVTAQELCYTLGELLYNDPTALYMHEIEN